MCTPVGKGKKWFKDPAHPEILLNAGPGEIDSGFRFPAEAGVSTPGNNRRIRAVPRRCLSSVIRISEKTAT